jgi:hypothetical protein
MRCQSAEAPASSAPGSIVSSNTPQSGYQRGTARPLKAMQGASQAPR